MRRLFGAAFALGLLAAGTPVHAQEQAREARAGVEAVESRFVGGWAYVPVGDIPGPFVTTHVSSVTGLGGYELDVSADLRGPIDARTRGLQYISLLQRFDGQFALFDRLAVRVSGQGEGLIPDTRDSAITLAIDGTWGAGGGLVGQLLRDDRMMLSLFAEYSFLRRTLISPAAALEELATERRFGDLLNRQDVHRLAAGPSWGLAITDWLGIVAEAAWETEWQSDDFSDRDDANDAIDLRGAATVNFWREPIPLGISAFWRQSIPLGGDNPLEFTRRYGGGIFYTGRAWLDVGVEVFREESEREPGSILIRNDRHYVAPRIRGYF